MYIIYKLEQPGTGRISFEEMKDTLSGKERHMEANIPKSILMSTPQKSISFEEGRVEDTEENVKSFSPAPTSKTSFSPASTSKQSNTTMKKSPIIQLKTNDKDDRVLDRWLDHFFEGKVRQTLPEGFDDEDSGSDSTSAEEQAEKEKEKERISEEERRKAAALKALNQRKKEEKLQTEQKKKQEEEKRKLEENQRREEEEELAKLKFTPHFEKRLQDLFDAFDLDSNHQLTFTELSKRLGDEWASWYMEQMDGYGDRDGTVSSLEWRTYFKFLINGQGMKKAMDVLSHFVHAINEG